MACCWTALQMSSSRSSQKVRLVLLKPEEGESIEDFLARMKAKQGGGYAHVIAVLHAPCRTCLVFQ